MKSALAIAKSLGIPHPSNKKTKALEVMTTDFVITIKRSGGEDDQVRTVKYIKDLTKPRVMEKFEIERIYFSNRDMSWGIVTELDIDLVITENVEWVHPCRYLTLLNPLTKNLTRKIKSYLEPCLRAENLPLHYFTDACDKHLGLEKGTSLLAVRHLIATRQLLVDMTVPLRPEKKITLL